MNRFSAFFKRHSFIGSVCLYGTLYGSGDLVRQLIQSSTQPRGEEQQSVDFSSSWRMATIGAGLLAPIYFGWYKILDGTIRGTSWKIILGKTAIDQVVAGTLGTCLFYTGECRETLL